MIPMIAPVDRPPVDDEVGAEEGGVVGRVVGAGSTKTN